MYIVGKVCITVFFCFIRVHIKNESQRFSLAFISRLRCDNAHKKHTSVSAEDKIQTPMCAFRTLNKVQVLNMNKEEHNSSKQR